MTSRKQHFSMAHFLDILLLSIVITLTDAVQPCYYSWNTTIAQSPPFVLPCSNTTNAFVSCCAYNPDNLYDPGNYCLSHNLCLANSNPTAFYLSPCTDPHYADSSCPQYCQHRVDNNELRVTYNPQIGKWQCCASDDCSIVTDEEFDAPAPADLIVVGPADLPLPTSLFPTVPITKTVGGSTPTTSDSASSTVSTLPPSGSTSTPLVSASASDTGAASQASTSTSPPSSIRAPISSSSTSPATESSGSSSTPPNSGNSNSNDGGSSKVNLGAAVGVPVSLAGTGWIIMVLIAIFSREGDRKEKAKVLATFRMAGQWPRTGHQTQRDRGAGGHNVGSATVGRDQNTGTGAGQHQAVQIFFGDDRRRAPRTARRTKPGHVEEHDLSDFASSATTVTQNIHHPRSRTRDDGSEAEYRRSRLSSPGLSSRGRDSSGDALSVDASAEYVGRRLAREVRPPRSSVSRQTSTSQGSRPSS